MDRPIMQPLGKGEKFKVLKIIGKKGMKMPEHHSTTEVVISVQKGSAVLSMNGKNVEINTEKPVILPKDVPHALELTEDFEAFGIFPIEGEIEFN